MQKVQGKRLLVLASKLGYQTHGFAEAARKLGVEVFFGSDRCHRLEDPWGDAALPVHFEQPQQAAQSIVEWARTMPVDAILALGDRPTETAAYAAQALGLVSNSPESVQGCRNKLRQREILRAAGLPVPEFFSFGLSEPLDAVLPRVKFPCVVKPLSLAASQGVVRANDALELDGAVRRIRTLLESPEIQVTREPALDQLLVESYIQGQEVALEGLLHRGELRMLALFDKPDPLEGPYFEETIYVTPSRLPAEIRQHILECARSTARALQLTEGPLHAEFRTNDAGPWVLEAAARPIGGLCSRALRFGPSETGELVSLEELVVRQALGLAGSDLPRERSAAGVMMIPVPQSGILERVGGTEEAVRTPGVEEIQITARLHDFIAAWPEGSSYLGFIFARGTTPAEVETALRQAHSKLRFVLAPRLPVEHPAQGGGHGMLARS
ncbi:MAG TPA: ATP-grasp domain-containing protein [Candidatus Acidoferrales bacterium]|nr:ATP-grasp domain-containing protein [Candidatus Acidoferrales bacterium]